MKKNSKPCPKCGRTMHRQSSICHECYLAMHRKPESYVDRKCPICGKTFSVHISQIQRGQGIYCSRSCARSGSPTKQKQKPTMLCHTCGKPFERHRSELRKTKHGRYFCSPACWYEYHQRENHVEWTGGQGERMNPEAYRWRKSVLERDHGFCRLCLSQKNLEVHHIVRFGADPKRRWDVDNGITLCHQCHVALRNSENEYESALSCIAGIPVEVWECSV